MSNDRFFKSCFFATGLLMAVMFSFGLGKTGSLSWRVAVLPLKSFKTAENPSARKMRDFLKEGKFSDKEAMFWRKQ